MPRQHDHGPGGRVNGYRCAPVHRGTPDYIELGLRPYTSRERPHSVISVLLVQSACDVEDEIAIASRSEREPLVPDYARTQPSTRGDT